MKSVILGILFFSVLFYAHAVDANIDATCSSEQECRDICENGKFQFDVEGYWCAGNYADHKIGANGKCLEQADCGQGLYCKEKIGDDTCQAKLIDGQICASGEKGSDVCKNACKTGKSYADSNNETGVVWWTCGENKENKDDKDKTKVGEETGLNSSGSVSITNPLQYDTVEEFLGAVLSWARGIIVVLALVFIVIGAILYVISAGQAGMMEMAKKTITMAMAGLAIGIAAPSFLKEISKILGWTSVPGEGLTLSQIALNVLNFLLGIFGTLAIIMLLIGGIMYLTSAGDQNRIDSGKKIFKYSVIGILVAFSSLVIVGQIAKLLA